MALEYVGEEEKTVAAGTFACRHFRFVDDSADGMGGKTHPDYDMWVTADDDAMLVYGAIDGYMMNRYELVELTPVAAQLFKACWAAPRLDTQSRRRARTSIPLRAASRSSRRSKAAMR